MRFISVLRVSVAIVVVLNYFLLLSLVRAATNIKYWDFSDAANYTFSDSTKIHIANWKAKLTPLFQILTVVNNGDQGTLLNWSIRTITLWKRYAFVTSYLDDALNIIDISDPANPIVVKVVQDGDILWLQPIYLNGAYDMAITWNYLFIASRVSDYLNVVDISDPTNPLMVRAIRRSTVYKFNGIQWLFLSWNYLYVASTVDDAFQILDISDPTNPQPLWFYQDATLLNYAGSVYVKWNYAYVTAERWDSLVIIDISDPNNPTLVASLTNDATNWPFLDGSYNVIISWTKAFVAAYNSDALNLIDISNPTNPLFITWLINDNSTIRLNSARQQALDLTDVDYLYVSARISDSIQAFDISENWKIIPLTILRDNALLNGAQGIYSLWRYIYVNGYNADNWSIIERYYDNTTPYIQPANPRNYAGKLYSFEEILWPHNEWAIKYQISNDWWNTWYWWNGSSWVSTTDTTATEANTASEINLNISSFNNIPGTYQFTFRAFFISNWQQEVELDRIIVKADPIPPEMPNKILHLDAENTDGDWYDENEPLSGDLVSTWIDLTTNGHNAYETTAWNGAIYQTWAINWKPALYFDWTKRYEIANSVDINTNTAGYPTRAIWIVFKTSDDITTRQFIYEEWWSVNWWGIMIKNWRLYAWGWSESNWMKEEKRQWIDLGPINPNTTYSILIVHNGTNTDLQQNWQAVYFNGKLVSTKNFVEELNYHPGKIWLWWINNATIDLETNADIWLANWDNFKWWIGEFVMWNSVLSSWYIQDLNDYWKIKWWLDYINYPEINPPFANRTWVFTWTQNISFSYSDNIWIDTTSADIKIQKRWWVYWNIDKTTNIVWTNITTTWADYQINFDEEGLYKITFSIANLSWYRASKEVVFFANPWAISFPIFHRDWQNIDWDYDTANEPADGSLVSQIADIYFVHTATQSTTASQPTYYQNWINTHPAIYFDWVDDWLAVSDHRKINTTTNVYDQKSFAFVFKTSWDINSQQVIYEQWWWARWYWLTIQGGHLWAWIWNTIEWPAWEQIKYIDLGPIQPFETYYVVLSQDATNVDVNQNTWKAWLNGNLIWTLSPLYPQYPHGWDVGFGWMKDWMILQDWTAVGGNNYNFNGWIWEIISFNQKLTDIDVSNIFNYFINRWSPVDVTPPTITSIFPLSGQLLPIWNLDIKISYIDTWAWIDIWSATLTLEKWDATGWVWTDISLTGISWSNITTTWASYTMNNLSYGKYRFNFSISDLLGNSSSTGAIYYIDSPSFEISTGEIFIGDLISGNITYSTDVIITIKSVGSPFELDIFKQSNLVFDVYQINERNSLTWWGYDITPYDGILEPLLTGWTTIYTGWGTINGDGLLNVYTYLIRIWAKVDGSIPAWEYVGNIWFGVKFSY